MEAKELRIGNYVNQGKFYGLGAITAYELNQFNDSKNECGVTADYYKEWKPFGKHPAATATNIQEAIQAGVALFPEGGSRRLVLRCHNSWASTHLPSSA